jgi:hypothetical protein
VIDEVGYIPFEPEAANLFFQLVSSRYERASLIVTSNKPFGRWGEVFGDDVVAAAMIDRLVHQSNSVASPPAPSAKGPPHPLRLAVLTDDLCHHRLILATWGCCSLVSTIADSTRTPEQDPRPASP